MLLLAWSVVLFAYIGLCQNHSYGKPTTFNNPILDSVGADP